jgi:hypothetical protein
MLDPRYKLQCFNEDDRDYFRRMLEKEVEKEALRDRSVTAFFRFLLYKNKFGKKNIFFYLPFYRFFLPFLPLPLFFDFSFLPLPFFF